MSNKCCLVHYPHPVCMCRGKSQCPEMTQWWFPEESGALATENSSVYWQGAYITKPTATCRQEGLVRNRVTGAVM